MQETDWLFWGIAFFFYLPLHLGTPMLFLLIRGDIETLKDKRASIIKQGLISAVCAFALALFLWPISTAAAGAVILFSILIPWLAIRR